MPTLFEQHPVTAGRFATGAAAAVLTLATGCQSYQPRPVDLPAAAAEFAARTPAQAASTGAGRFDPSDGLNLAEAQAVAMVFNAQLRLARLSAGAAQATAEYAGLWSDPVVGVDATRVLASVDHRWTLGATLGFTVPVSGRLAIQREKAGAQWRAELARVAEKEWAVRTDLARAWAHWSALCRQVEAEQALALNAAPVLAVIDAMERAGELARTEARLFHLEQESRRAQMLRLVAARQRALGDVFTLMGLAPGAKVELAPAPALRQDTALPADAAAELAAHNPAVRVALAEHQVAEEQLRLAVAGQYPDLSLAPGIGKDDGNGEVGLGFSMPIPIFNANRQEIAHARAQRELTAAAAQAALEHALARLHTAAAAMHAAVALAEQIEHAQVPLAAAQQREARELARLGEVNTLVLLQSMAQGHATTLALIEAQRDAELAAIDVRDLLGPPNTPDEPITPSTPQPAAQPGGAP